MNEAMEGVIEGGVQQIDDRVLTEQEREPPPIPATLDPASVPLQAPAIAALVSTATTATAATARTEAEEEFDLKTDIPDVDEEYYEAPVVAVPSIDGFHKWKWLDALDDRKKWYEAYVVDLDVEGKRILIHYHGWKSKFDEWIRLVEDSERIAPLGTNTGKSGNVRLKVSNLRPGLNIDCKDHTGKFFEARIAEVVNFNGTNLMARITWPGFGAQYDIYLPADSYRIAPHRSITQEQQANLDYNRNRHIQNSKIQGVVPTSTNEDMFRDVLKRHLNSEIVLQAGDGNCLFRSVSHQIYGNAEHHRTVRQYCMDYIQTESDFFANFVVGSDMDFKSYVTDMRRDGAWGDHVEIQAMSEIYCRPVEVYAYSHTPLRTYRQDSNADAPPIRLSYHFRSHYNSIVNEDTFSLQLLTTRPGLIEQEAIDRAQARKIAGVARPAEDSGGSAADAGLRRAIELSRSDFRGLDFSADVMAGKSLEQLMGDSEVAKQASILEYHRKTVQSQAEMEMKLALEMSARDANVVHQPELAPMMLDSDLELAMQMSLHESKVSAPPVAVPSPVLPASDDLPFVVMQCMELGFPLEKVMAAYGKFRNDSVAPERVVQNMTNYLLMN